MTEKIVITANIGVQNGPSINVNRVMEVQAYEKIKVNIKSDDTDKVVDLWPSNNTGEVLLLAMVSSWYGADKPGSPFVTYKVNDKEGDVEQEVFTLDQPLLLIGNSPVSMLNAVPKKLKFSYKKTDNTTPDSIEIQILIGLKVTA